MTSLYMALFVLLFCIGLFYIYQYIQEGFGRGGRGMGMGGRGMGIRRGRGRGYYGGPRRRVFYYPTYLQGYDAPEVYIYPAQTSYVASFNDYLRWLFGYR